MDYKLLWEAKDDRGNEVVLGQVAEDRWSIEVTEGSFSGYPAVLLDRDQLRSLFNSIGYELD